MEGKPTRKHLLTEIFSKEAKPSGYLYANGWHLPSRVFAFFILILLSAQAYGQFSLKANLSAGYASNNAIYLNNQRVTGASGMLLTASGLAELALPASFFIETGLSGKMVLASGHIGITDYSSRTFRVSVPIMAGRSITEELRVLAGMAIQNNRDFDVFRAREKYNLRYDLRLKGYYRLANRWSMLASLQYNFHIPDPYLINDPKMCVMVGISFNLGDGGAIP